LSAAGDTNVKTAPPRVQPPSHVSSALREVVAELRPDAEVADVGCGGGAQLRALGPGAVGVDALPGNVSQCEALGLRAVLGDLNGRLPFADHRFDAVLLSHVLEHMDSPLRSLMECARVLKQGGLVIVGVPLESSISRTLLRDPYYSHEGHLYAFTPNGMRAIVSAAGYEQVRLMFDIPLARRTGSRALQRTGDRWLPESVKRRLCANMWCTARTR
jgi:SAM-dependent methyltransferase